MRILNDVLRRLGPAVWLFTLCLSTESAFTAPPTIIDASPAPGFVNELTAVTVAFNEPVTGVRANDFLVNGVPATGVEGSGETYKFSFDQPAFGAIDISWGTLHTIASVAEPFERFDGGAAASTWAYQLVNPAGPVVTSRIPLTSATLRRLGEVELSFDRPVAGVNAADLLLNGSGALSVTGVGAGPYRFTFVEAGAGQAAVSWNPGHGIVADDEGAAAFDGSGWSYTVAPDQPAPDVVLNELLAENQTGLADEDTDQEDWIELRNRGVRPFNLGGWSLSVDREEEGQWVFPHTILPPGGYLLIWASGKDRRDPEEGQRFHTNFKLNAAGDTLRLFGPELPRTLVDEVDFPEQSPDYSYGRQGQSAQGPWSYLAESTPAALNATATVTGKVGEVHFSVERGLFNAPFNLTLACETAGAEIRYTLNGSPPATTNGIVYTTPIAIETTRVVRAAAFAPNQLSSRTQTHSYFMNLANNRRLLPVLSLVTATNNLYGRNGIMESSPRNTTKHGVAWERPVSVEWVDPKDNGGFQVDAGIRVAGGDYIRERYNYRTSKAPEGKYSFRLYFRGDYGAGRLNYRVLPGSTVESFNNLHVRAGMNDHTNPFIKDEFIRGLSLDVGIPACHGAFVYLFLNGVYKGLYNPCERVDDDFLQAYHGGGEFWDVIGPGNVPIRGDGIAWSQLRTAVRKDLTVRSNYLDVATRMDLTNFVDYLLPLIWADNDDWPHNNTRAAREKRPGAPFRFYPWDAEFAFTSHPVAYDTIAGTLSSLRPPWGTTDYQAMFNSLKKAPEFRLLFADRVHRAFFNDGPLTDARIRTRYNGVKTQVASSIQGFSDVIGSWISRRRPYVLNSFQRAGFLASSNAPAPSQLGGRVPAGYSLALQNLSGAILFTTNGTDPRVPFTGLRSPSAMDYQSPLILNQALHLKARSLDGANWSAVVDLFFQVNQIGSPLRITEIMFNPPGGDAFEFVELENTGALPVNLSGCSFDGIRFRFPTPFPELAPGARIVVANDSQPDEFKRRYPGLPVAGWFAGALNNSGERVALIDAAGTMIASVTFSDVSPWPAAADGAGSSLEVRDALGDPDDPANWQASLQGGSPGSPNSAPAPPAIRINELNAGTDGDWLELYNSENAAVSLGGWSLTDDSNPRQFTLPAGSTIPAGGFIQIKCRSDAPAGGLTAPFQLKRDGETVSLFNASGARVDVVRFGPVVDMYTIGFVNDRLVLCEPTPLAPNKAAVLGSLENVKINEFLANSDAAEDWIEFYNSGALPISLKNCIVVTSNAIARIAAPVFLQAGGFVALRADEAPGPDHLGLKVTADGGWIALFAPDGEELDRVSYPAQFPEITTGRFPDGIGAFQQFPFGSTMGGPNHVVQLGTELRISEVLARSTTSPDWVEIENVSGVPFDLSGFSLGVQAHGAALSGHPLRAGAQLAPGERMLLYFGPLPAGFVLQPGAHAFSPTLSDTSSTLTLRDQFDRVVDRVEYGLQIPDRSFGRVNLDWKLLANPSPGEPNGSAADLDSGDDIRINEWLAAGAGTNEFVELFNPAFLPVSLGGWVLTDDPSIQGSTNQRLATLTFIDARGYAQLHADGEPENGLDHTPFQLDRLGETIRLLDADARIIDTVDFSVQTAAVAEGRFPDGGEMIVRFPGSATPGAPNIVRMEDADGDGMDDAWEVRHGLNPNSSADAQFDSDTDGMSNLAEFLSGTDPQTATSVLRLELLSVDPNGPILRFIAQADRAYSIQLSDSLSPSAWRALADISAEPTMREIAVIDSVSPLAERPARFYRVVTRP